MLVIRIHLLLFLILCFFFFFFNDTATTEIYTLSLHDALPNFVQIDGVTRASRSRRKRATTAGRPRGRGRRSEEHTSELQSRPHLVCRLLLEKKNRIRSTLTDRSAQSSNK